ncbi:MAG: hypothetical protein WC476_01040 [Phycisphaerae bacterium]|jgi:hypothetical protein
MEISNPLTKEQADALYALLGNTSGWDAENFDDEKQLDASATTINQLANIVANLIIVLKNTGILGG